MIKELIVNVKELKSTKTVDMINFLIENGYATNDTSKGNYYITINELNFNGYRCIAGEYDMFTKEIFLTLEEEK